MAAVEDQYNDAVGSFDRRVVPQLRRIEQAGASSDRPVAGLDAIEDAPRVLTAGLQGQERAEPPRLVPSDLDPFGEVA